jgi:fatty acid amide hydrolase 2
MRLTPPSSASHAPPRDHDVRTWSGLRIARAIASGECTSQQVVATHLAHLMRVNGPLNAVVATRVEAALAEARAADDARALGEVGPPFAGVPCTVKESIALTGMPLTAGLVSRRGVVSRTDAVTVRRLRAAGAIPLGVTNISELLMWMESDNRVYGRCHNPYDHARTAGGSSGGEGASVGAGIAPFGLGADVGGSIRLPAFFNGVFGHKATGGLIPNAGQWPIAHGKALRYLTTGPLARRAEDLWPLVRLLAGPDPESPECASMPLGDPADVSLEGMRVLNVPDNGLQRVDGELVAAQERAAQALRARGAEVETRRFPALKKSVLYWSSMMSAAGGEEFATMLGGGTPKALFPEFVRLAFGRSDHTLPALALAALEQIPKRWPSNTDALVREGESLRDELAECIGDGVMLFPSYTRPAPRHAAAILTPIDWGYTAILNVLELPSTQVPLGLSHRGLPLGCQVVGRHGQDHRTIAVALELERALGGWTPPALFGAP